MSRPRWPRSRPGGIFDPFDSTSVFRRVTEKVPSPDSDKPSGGLRAPCHIGHGQIFSGSQKPTDSMQAFSPDGFQQAHLQFNRGDPGPVPNSRGKPAGIVDQRCDGTAVEILHGVFEAGVVRQ